MAWDDDKSTATDPNNPTADEQLTADEWDAHVTEGHWPGNELNLGLDSGDPVLTDPQNADKVVLRYDRASGSWLLDSVTPELVQYDYSSNFPQHPRQPEVGVPQRAMEYPGVENPVLTGSDVTDAPSGDGVADPFIVFESGTYYLICESLNDARDDNNIVYATSTDGLSWTYQSKLIDKATNASYPYTFKWDGTWYMTPNLGSDVDLYSASSPDGNWTLDQTLVSNTDEVDDPTLIRWNGKWYAFYHDPNVAPEEMKIYYADSLKGTYSAHSNNPVHSGGDLVRCGGRPIVTEDRIWMPRRNQFTDTNGSTRENVVMAVVDELSTTSYNAVKSANSPVATYTEANRWNHDTVHHWDQFISSAGGRSIVVVDGFHNDEYSLGLMAPQMGHQINYHKMHWSSGLADSTSGSYTTVPLDAINSNPYDACDINNNKITVPESGLYSMDAVAGLDGGVDTTGFRLFTRIRDTTNSDSLIFNFSHVDQTNSLVNMMSLERYLEKGTELKLQIYQDSGSAQPMNQGEDNAFLSIHRVG